MIKIDEVIFCWDFIVSMIIAVSCGILLPKYLNIEFLNSMYSIAVTLLSILFSLFFAALTLIMISNADDFILFLEEDNIYSGIIATFKITLIITFISLLISIIMYAQTMFLIKENYINQNKIFFIIFVFSLFYSLFAIINSVIDSIKYSEKRIQYIKIKNTNKK